MSSTSSTSSMDSMVSSDQFLQLFCTQLQNQDPLSPMDSNSFTQQLAQLSSVEKLVSISDSMTTLNTTMDTMLSYQASLNNQYASTLIGRTVTYGDSGAGGQVTGVDFTDGTTSLTLGDGTTISLGDVKTIKS